MQRKGARRHYAKLKTAALEILGDKCSRCKVTDVRVLQIDHRAAGGARERRRFNSQDRLYREVVKHPDRYQLLCANCNWIKRWERLEHKRQK